MPGSPYLDEPPKGLLTWRKLLGFSIPSFLMSGFLAFHYDVVMEMMVVFTIFFTLSAMLRR